MEILSVILNPCVGQAIDFAGLVSGHPGLVFDPLGWLLNGGATGAILASAVVAIPGGGPSEGDRANARRWHGSIDDKFNNLDLLVNLLTKNKTKWNVPELLLATITAYRNDLQKLIPLCRSSMGTLADRDRRNTVLNQAIGYCLLDVKAWAISQYTAGALYPDEVRTLGFLLPGDTGGHYDRTEPTKAIAEVKVQVLSAENINVIIDQAAEKDAGPVLRGWPGGVRQALIVITAIDGKKEIYRQLTTRLHTTVAMPADSHGKQFAIKAAFLRHIDDAPNFGPEPTFSMPLTTDDLINRIDQQHHDDYEARQREIEAHRREIARLEAMDNG
jgi:hypothetical protein